MGRRLAEGIGRRGLGMFGGRRAGRRGETLGGGMWRVRWWGAAGGKGMAAVGGEEAVAGVGKGDGRRVRAGLDVVRSTAWASAAMGHSLSGEVRL